MLVIMPLQRLCICNTRKIPDCDAEIVGDYAIAKALYLQPARDRGTRGQPGRDYAIAKALYLQHQNVMKDCAIRCQ